MRLVEYALLCYVVIIIQFRGVEEKDFPRPANGPFLFLRLHYTTHVTNVARAVEYFGNGLGFLFPVCIPPSGGE